MTKLGTLLLAALLGGTAPAAAQQDGAPLYRLESATSLPSTDTDWDYSKLEPHGSRLFMARRKDGLVVYDVDSRAVVATIANSAGANGPLLLPQFNRGYVAMTDGTLLAFELKSLKVLARTRLADDGGLNGAMYDPSTKHIQVVVGARTAESAWFTLDAATGKLLGKTVFPFKKMDDPATNGKGTLFAPARFDNVVLKLDARTLKEQARWTVGDCIQPVAVEYQAHTDRVLIGCRGDKPVFIALDAQTGRVIATVPIGKGIDGMAVDERRHRILTSNGGDASLSVIEQTGADEFRLLGNVMTRPNARIMQIDERDGRVYIVTAEHSVLAPTRPDAAAKTIYHPDSFVVLTYRPQ